MISTYLQRRKAVVSLRGEEPATKLGDLLYSSTISQGN
ncbi:hypothetical protein POREN0001_1769 [Porphyromonas endodontalis ATCC 35406]|uniref:Uncharacterized protein n=1 Tax=Porphyromonas endodontalis (strain ATCC 35406 / DSM 24491 / JCM 8526 / CCUG 16442 / BCRC 14492 / NCTC 13058 / HG 370) TaxID=553175 RepID=C3JBN4_POREA|nr:hypothetical protein POREN0001_1769 [Porphyromonas endodontalis ATCC 35406]